jgi:hypothetical protein
VALCVPATLAQEPYQGAPSNLRNFYMARQQVHIIDESPMVTRSTIPGGQQGGGGAHQPQNLNRPVSLPKAGFQPYFTSGQQMGGNSSLPTTSNGVPRQAPPRVVQGLPAGKPGAIRRKGAPVTAATKPTGAPVTKAYNPYGGYGGGQASGMSYGSGAGSGSNSSSRNVKGSVMSWKKNRGF